MKKTATTLMLLASFGGGCVSPGGHTGKKTGQPGGFGTVTRQNAIPGVQGPGGEPISMMPVSARGAAPVGVPQARYGMPSTTVARAIGVQQAGAPMPGSYPGGLTRAHIPGNNFVQPANFDAPMMNGPSMGGPSDGIYPVPGQGAPGASANFGAIIPGRGGMTPGMPASGICNTRSSIRFTGPAGMKITWQLPSGGFNDEASGLTAPKEYNFLQGQVYRLRLSQILPNFPGRIFYPTLEVSPANPKTLTFLSHASVPVTFTNEDFDQVVAGNLVVKVIYLPDPTFQDFAVVAGAEEIVSTRLEPGADPIVEAQRRGTILAVIRIGNIDLENRAAPAMTAVPGAGMPGPGMMPPGAGPAGPAGANRPTMLPPGVANVNTQPVPPRMPSAPMTAPVAPTQVSPRRSTTMPTAPLPPAASNPVPMNSTIARPAMLPNINAR